MVPTHRLKSLCTGIGLAVACTLAPAAEHAAHQHGVARLDVSIDGPLLTLQLEAPLDSLLGFEHRPRTVAERGAASAVLQRMVDTGTLWRPTAAALCVPGPATVEAPVLQASAPAKEEGHGDLDARYEFRCAQPGQLTGIELGLFAAFKRIQRIEVQVAGPQGQVKRVLKAPEKQLSLRR